EYTDPEILRTNLASVILQMASLGLGDVAAFPFVDGPDHRQIKDGVNLLNELGALQPDTSAGKRRLTKIGRNLAQLPVDPRLGRMILEAEKRDCLGEVLVITSALSIQDPANAPPTNNNRPSRPTPGSPRRNRTSSPTSTCGTTCRPSNANCRGTGSANCAARNTSTTCVYANGRTSTASSDRFCARWTSPYPAPARPQPTRARYTCPCSPGCSPTSDSRTPKNTNTWADAAHALRSSPARRCSRNNPA